MKAIDLSCDVAGRFAAKLLAMAGFEVIRPDTQDDPLGLNADESLATYLDAHKLTVPESTLGAAAELLAEADVVFTSFDRGQYLGAAAKPLPLSGTCIHVTTSTFGTRGPYSKLRGGPLADWAAGGYLAITGDPEREPLMGPEHLCGYVAGYTTAMATEAALRDRQRSGVGQHLDISIMESMLCVHQSTFSRLGAGIVRQRTGRYAEVYPLVVRPCQQGLVSLGIVTDNEFDRLAIAFEMPELAADQRFSTVSARWENRDALDRELDRFLSRHDAAKVVEILQANDVAATQVATCSDILTNPQLDQRGFWTHPQNTDSALMPGNPVPPAKVFSTPDTSNLARRTPRNGGAHSASTLPLDGTLVLDFTIFWAGPSATRNLADLGAEVIWVERPGARIDLDTGGKDPAAFVHHLYHLKMNRGKKSIVLDLESQQGRETARRLANEADVLVENFRPGVAERLGIGPADLCANNPQLVYVSLSGFGASGPWKDWRSYGPNIEAASSILDRTGYHDGEPLRLGHALPDGVGGIVGTLAALRGLREREQRGCGGWYDISQLEAYTAICGEEILATSLRGCSSPRIGNRSRYGAIQGVFPCKGEDQWVTIRLIDQHDIERFTNLTELRGVLDLAATTPRDEDAIEQLISSYTRLRDKQEIARVLQDAGLESMPVLSSIELVTDPQLSQRGFFVDTVINQQTFSLQGSPLQGSQQLTDPSGTAPRIGEHTEKVLAWLDASAQTI